MKTNVLRLICCTVLVLSPIASAGTTQKNEGFPHLNDYRTCPTCNAALQKSMTYLKANLQGKVLNSVWYAEMLGSFYAGFAFLMEGNSQKEAKLCADHICKYFDWAKHHMGYEGWFCSMSMMYLTEYSLRYGVTPEIQEKLEWGAKWCHKTREKEGGWFHGPRWGQGNYALDISSVGCGYYLALEEMKVLGLQTGPALDDVRDYVSKVCDGRSVAYGLYGRGGFSLAASSYILIGLTSSGQNNDPRVAGISDFLKQNYRDIRKAHASGMLHHFGVAAALHRVGPEAYGPFAQHYLHELIIPNQRDDGTIGIFPNDNTQEAAAAYAPLKETGDYVSTAILTAMILMERPGAFSPTAVKKKDAITNKEAYRLATEALKKNDVAKAFKYYSEVLPLGDSEELVPLAQAELKKIEPPIRQKLKEVQDRADKEIPEAKALAESKDYRGAISKYDGVIKAYSDLLKEYAGVPFIDELKTQVAELKKAIPPLAQSLAFGGGGSVKTTSATTSSNTPSANASAPVPAAPAGMGKLKDPGLAQTWETKLKERVKAVLGSGAKVRMDFKSLNQRVTLTSVDAQDSFKANLEKGGQLDLRWSQFKTPECLSLALDLAQTQGTPADASLAAFFLLHSGEQEKAHSFLEKAGSDGAAVREAFSP